jgi:hypothetical protein
MNNKPNLPEEVWASRKYHWATRLAWRVNGWMWVAIIISMIADMGIPEEIRKWNIALRIAVAIFPFLASLLWVRNLARWIHGMDELHRRIMLSACLSAAVGTLFVFTFFHVLDKMGICQISSVLDAVWVMDSLLGCFCFYSYQIFRRRYE